MFSTGDDDKAGILTDGFQVQASLFYDQTKLIVIGKQRPATLNAIKQRIDLFHKVTLPVVSHYKRRRILEEVDGERSIKEIHKDIMKRLKKYEDK